jgi:hypothetical protein
MVGSNNPNLEMLELAVNALGDVADDLVFLGGCATGLLLTDAAAPPIRMTRDVDAIAEVASLGAYYALSDRLRGKGFSEDSSDGSPICRWTGYGVLLDVMPTHPEVLGFGNEWYRPAMKVALRMALPSGMSIRLVTAPYFLATKLAAFDGRGRGDYLMSHDIEDMVAVLDGRPEIVEESLSSDPRLRVHLSRRFSDLLTDSRFLSAVHGHLPADSVSQERAAIVMQRIKSIAETK